MPYAIPCIVVRLLFVAGLLSIALPAVAQQPDPQWIQQQLDATQQRIQQLERSLAAMEQPAEARQKQPADPFATKWPPDLHQSAGDGP